MTPKNKRIMRIDRLTEATGSGSYSHDLGAIAFGDPLEQVERKAKEKIAAAERYKEYYSKKKLFSSGHDL